MLAHWEKVCHAKFGISSCTVPIMLKSFRDTWHHTLIHLDYTPRIRKRTIIIVLWLDALDLTHILSSLII